MRVYLYIFVRIFGPVNYRGEDAVYVFLKKCILRDEAAIWADLANKKPLLMAP